MTTHPATRWTFPHLKAVVPRPCERYKNLQRCPIFHTLLCSKKSPAECTREKLLTEQWHGVHKPLHLASEWLSLAVHTSFGHQIYYHQIFYESSSVALTSVIATISCHQLHDHSHVEYDSCLVISSSCLFSVQLFF